MALLRSILIVCFGFLCVNCELNNDLLRDTYYQASREYIDNFLKYLNGVSDRTYNFNYKSILNAQKKGENAFRLRIEAIGECRQDISLPTCTKSEFICDALVNRVDDKYEVHPGSTCVPKLHESKTGVLSQDKIVINRPKKVFCTGCPIDLDTNVDGLNVLVDTALHHIESERTNKHTLIKVLRVQQQVVAGVKYILLIEIASTSCPKSSDNLQSCSVDPSTPSEICQIVYYQKPWISKAKNIIGNNCTVSQDYLASASELPVFLKHNDHDNEIDVNHVKRTDVHPAIEIQQPNFEKIAETGHIDEDTAKNTMTPSRLAELESQIIAQVAPSPAQPADDSIFTAVKKDEKTDQDVLNLATKFSLANMKPKVVDDSLFLADQPAPPCKNAHDKSDDSSSEENKHEKHSHDKSDDSSSEGDKKHTHSKHSHDKSDDSSSEEDKKHSHSKHSHDKSDDSSSEDDSKSHKKPSDEDTDEKKSKSLTSSDSDSSDDDKKQSNKVDLSDSDDSDSKSDDKKSNRTDSDDSDSDSTDEVDCKCHLRKHHKHKHDSDSDDTDEDDDHRHHKRKHHKKGDKDSSSSSSSSPSSSSSSSSSENTEESHNKKSKRHRRSPSHEYHLDNVNPEEKDLVQHLAGIAAATLDDIDEDNRKRIVLQVLKTNKETLKDGLKYHLLLRLGVSRCSEDVDALPYEPKEDECKKNLIRDLTKICKVQMLINEEKTSPKILKSQCHIEKDDLYKKRGFRSRRQVRVGGAEQVDVSDSHIVNLVQKSLSQLDATSNSDKRYQTLEIISASKQVVAGALYKIKVKIVSSDCSKDKELTDDCKALEGAEPRICNIKIWDQPWLPNGRQTNITCEDEEVGHSFRSKRSLKLHSSSHLLGKDDHDINFGMFKEFMQKHGKTYETKKEYKFRFRVFRQNMKKVYLLNKHEQGTAKYGATRFADMTSSEFKKMLGYKPELRNENNIEFPQAEIPDIDLPVEFDWRSKGVVSEVKNQGMCGSCWAFSVTGNVEGQYAIKNGKLLEFSEQELVDCDKSDSGCSGGLMDNAYRAIEKIGGLETESDYPYEGDNEKCHFNKSLAAVQLSGAVNISHDETDMAKWLVKNGPISIAINANAMQFYFGGVSHPFKFLCSPNNLDHGVLIVGYGVHKYPYLKKTLPYWLVKNSWGKSWGQQGYYLVYRGDGTCGLNQTPSSAIVA